MFRQQPMKSLFLRSGFFLTLSWKSVLYGRMLPCRSGVCDVGMMATTLAVAWTGAFDARLNRPESWLTNPPGHLWRDKWTALSGPLSQRCVLSRHTMKTDL